MAGAELRQWGLVSWGRWTVPRRHGGYNCLSRGMWGLRECGHTMSVDLGALMPQKGLSCQGSRSSSVNTAHCSKGLAVWTLMEEGFVILGVGRDQGQGR